ncbi:hypothetical protein AK830_g11278 [Neonectria ditissima]|uniref:Protein kinase domain-containing protein n=1 Tax=Neonectria ditissima TaxID=78410 RepID=A0A0P7B1T6_9HYPO|nr:hypothetical protein AK830_g11278 [Neonectria ditissima]
MTFSGRFSFALAGLCVFLATGVTADAALVKRDVPDFIQSWALYQRWDTMTESIPEFDVPDVDDVTVAVFDKTAGTLKWTCNTLVLGDQISAFTSIIQKASLDTYDQPTVVTKRSYSERTQVLYGARLQKSISNENVLPVIDYVYSDAVPADRVRAYGWSIMPYVSAGSLETNFGSYTDQTSINAAFKQILNAVAAVSAAGILHRDLKPENFLKDGDTLKLMDFDQSRQTATSLQYDVGTPSYTAPEIIAMQTEDGFEYDTKADTFSTAMIFMVLSVSELQDATARFQLWKDVIQPDGALWPSAEKVADVLSKKNYAVFTGNDGLLNVLAKALCKPSERYDPPSFQSAFNGVA